MNTLILGVVVVGITDDGVVDTRKIERMQLL